jgi:putative DNA primase/helicase
MSDLLESGLDYADRGWPVFAVNGKVPFAGTRGFYDATTDPELIRKLWRERNGSNVAIRTGKASGLIVLDVDPDADGDHALARFEAEHGALPPTVEAITPSGGRHLYFALPDGVEVASGAGVFGPGVDVRAEGGYVVAPPSIGYRWELSSHPDETPVAAVPTVVLRRLSGNGLRAPRHLPDVVPEGQRENILCSLAGTMRNRGASEDGILAALRAENDARCRPPLEDADLQRIARSYAKYPPGAAKDTFLEFHIPTWSTPSAMGFDPATQQVPPPQSPQQRAHATTDLGNAEAFVDLFARQFVYVPQHRAWYQWRNGRWRRDETGEAQRAAKEVARDLLRRAADIADPDAQKRLVKWALETQTERRLRSLLALAGTEPELVLAADALDRDPWLFTCGNGTLDLRTGDLRAHDPADLISLGTDVDHDAGDGCPRWLRFLAEVFDGDEELTAFLRRAFGYSLTGITREHVLFVLHGTGRNGKTTLLEVLQRIAGEFAQTTPFDTFARVRGGHGARNDLARLHRARVALAAESGEGRRLDEVTIKLVTGGDTIAARFLYAEHFEYRPMFKVWLTTNHRPRVDGDDDAMWARLRLIPFEVSFRGREDRGLVDKLARELPGILAWAVQGCLEWQRDGLGTAKAVDNATAEYREDEDVLGAFLSERCELIGWVEAADFRPAYEAFCKELGERPLAASALGRRLKDRGFSIERAHGARIYRGLRLQESQS